MVKAGVGITLLPNSMCNKNPIDDLVVVPVVEPTLSYQIALANNKIAIKVAVAKRGNN